MCFSCHSLAQVIVCASDQPARDQGSQRALPQVRLICWRKFPELRETLHYVYQFIYLCTYVFIFYFIFCLLRAAPAANGGSQTTAAHLPHSHSNAWSLTHWARPRIEPTTSWFLVGLVSAAPRWELLEIHVFIYTEKGSKWQDTKYLSYHLRHGNSRL